jgi:RNase H-fold protein (predicted Holliday junction resolvase)
MSVLAPGEFVRRVLGSGRRRILAVDVGATKCGLALAEIGVDGGVEFVRPLDAVYGSKERSVSRGVWDAARRVGAVGLVVGWPVDAKGEVTEACDRTVGFLKALTAEKGASELGVLLADEYGSTVTARAALIASRSAEHRRPLGRVVTRIDTTAAMVLLHGFLKHIHRYVPPRSRPTPASLPPLTSPSLPPAPPVAPAAAEVFSAPRLEGEGLRRPTWSQLREGGGGAAGRSSTVAEEWRKVLEERRMRAQSGEPRKGVRALRERAWVPGAEIDMAEEELDEALQRGVRRGEVGWDEAAAAVATVVEGRGRVRKSSVIHVDPEGTASRA